MQSKGLYMDRSGFIFWLFIFGLASSSSAAVHGYEESIDWLLWFSLVTWVGFVFGLFFITFWRRV